MLTRVEDPHRSLGLPCGPVLPTPAHPPGRLSAVLLNNCVAKGRVFGIDFPKGPKQRWKRCVGRSDTLDES